jgi:serine/threonine protein kinase/Flp pilus assembly protein TadD
VLEKDGDWPVVGTRLGEYKLERELGRGAFARVFLASEATTGDRPVALKLTHDGLAEACMLGRLPHPNIVPILSARKEEATGLTLVCMPFLGRATLDVVLARAFPGGTSTPPSWAAMILDAIRSTCQPDDPAPPATSPDPILQQGSYLEGVVHLGGQLARALAFLHEHQLCHLDLKPSNVLLDPAGQPLLLDFNLSADSVKAPPRVGGTPAYMAPEQLRAYLDRLAAPPDPRSDLYSLGVILYQLLTGSHPFGPLPSSPDAKELGSFLLQRQWTGCRPMRAVNPRVPARVAQVIESCLAFDTAARPASAGVFAAALERTCSRRLSLGQWCLAATSVAASLLFLLAFIATAAWWRSSSALAEARVADPDGEYRAGRAAFRARNLAAAEKHFERALSRDPDHAQALFGRGVVRLALNDPESARLFLIKVHKRKSNGATLACLAYCSALCKEHERAILYSEKAHARGFAPAIVLNNWACSCIQTNRLEEARTRLREAIRRDPTLQAAYYNRVVLAIGMRRQRMTPAIPDEALTDVQHALELGPPSADLHLQAARLYALAAADDTRSAAEIEMSGTASQGSRSPHAERALAHLRDAIALGLPVGSLERDPIFPSGLGPDWAVGLPRPGAPQLITSALSGRLVNPVTDLLD